MDFFENVTKNKINFLDIINLMISIIMIVFLFVPFKDYAYKDEVIYKVAIKEVQSHSVLALLFLSAFIVLFLFEFFCVKKYKHRIKIIRYIALLLSISPLCFAFYIAFQSNYDIYDMVVIFGPFFGIVTLIYFIYLCNYKKISIAKERKYILKQNENMNILIKYKILLDKNAITEKEFDRKKKELIR